MSTADLQAQMAAHGVEGHPFFVGDGFAKIFRMPAGKVIGQHRHKVGHLAMLILGKVRVTDDFAVTEYEAPTAIVLPAHVGHEIESLTPALWACVWPNADGALTEDDFEAMVIE
jgi:quercetin dioxygenase-like cupin family protein